MIPRIVFDCMIFLQAAARAAGPAAACLGLVKAGHVELVVSEEIIAEVRDVLTRPKIIHKFPALTVNAVELFLLEIRQVSTCLEQIPRKFELPRDPKDEPYVNLALAGAAEYLVTRDRDMLDLMDDESFRESFPGLSILDPVAFLKRIEGE